MHTVGLPVMNRTFTSSSCHELVPSKQDFSMGVPDKLKYCWHIKGLSGGVAVLVLCASCWIGGPQSEGQIECRHAALSLNT